MNKYIFFTPERVASVSKPVMQMCMVFGLFIINMQTANSELLPNATLIMDSGTLDYIVSDELPEDGNGSWFAMEAMPGELILTNLEGFNHLKLGVLQLASVDHPDIDNPWLFFGNLGVHQLTAPVEIITDNNAGAVTLDFTGWDVSWGGIPSTSLDERSHSGGVDGVANLWCENKCESGDSYILEYFSTVPDGDVSGFGNVKYSLHIEGIVDALYQKPGPHGRDVARCAVDPLCTVDELTGIARNNPRRGIPGNTL